MGVTAAAAAAAPAAAGRGTSEDKDDFTIMLTAADKKML